MAGNKGGGTGAGVPPEGAAETGSIAGLAAGIDRLLEGAEEPDRLASLEAEIERLLEGFDDRLALVNRRLDRVLERRA